MQINNNQPPYSTSELLDKLEGIQHGFFGSQGGVSSGVYQSLNCGFSSNDSTVNVGINRQRVASCFSLDDAHLFSLRQAHTNKVIQVTPDTKALFSTQADGMVSQFSGVALGVLGADCAPVLLVDPVNKIIGAAHSGHKGALSGISEAVIESMCQLGADVRYIKVAVGPAMQADQFEVKEDFMRVFMENKTINALPFFHKSEERITFDTPAYIEARLRQAGVTKIDRWVDDTFSQPDKYFSYRRACHAGESDYGRQISVICLL